MAKPRIKVPDVIKQGEVIAVKTVMTHVMETGNRRDADGKPIARNIIHTVVARFAGEVVFRASLGSGISANPFLSFPLRVSGPGTLEMTWTDDEGATYSESAILNVA